MSQKAEDLFGCIHNTCGVHIRSFKEHELYSLMWTLNGVGVLLTTILRRGEAVSYTHLDVYKRQTLNGMRLQRTFLQGSWLLIGMMLYQEFLNKN